MESGTTWSLKEENGARQGRGGREGRSLLVVAGKADGSPARGGEVGLSPAGFTGITADTPGLGLGWRRCQEEKQDIGR